MSLTDLLAQNRSWAAAQVARDPEYFARMASGQHPRVLWIGCSDSRVPAEQVLGCGPGDLFVHRNVANIVAYNDINIAAVVQYAAQNLGIQDVVVCGHYGCGGIRAACATEHPSGYIGDWLAIAGWAQRAVDARLKADGRSLEGDDYLQLVVEENVRLQLTHLSHLSVVRDQRSRTPGIPRLHGWVYDIGTGLVKVVVPSEA
ncbi:MAG: carbonic anhydrase [Gemmatimonadota bacterium]